MGLVDTLKREFDPDDRVAGIRDPSETPPEGMPLVKMFPRADVDGMTRRLNRHGRSLRPLLPEDREHLEFETVP